MDNEIREIVARLDEIEERPDDVARLKTLVLADESSTDAPMCEVCKEKPAAVCTMCHNEEVGRLRANLQRFFDEEYLWNCAEALRRDEDADIDNGDRAINQMLDRLAEMFGLEIRFDGKDGHEVGGETARDDDVERVKTNRRIAIFAAIAYILKVAVGHEKAGAFSSTLSNSVAEALEAGHIPLDYCVPHAGDRHVSMERPVMTPENWKDIVGALQLRLDDCKERGIPIQAEELAFIALEDDYNWNLVHPDRV